MKNLFSVKIKKDGEPIFKSKAIDLDEMENITKTLKRKYQ